MNSILWPISATLDLWVGRRYKARTQPLDIPTTDEYAIFKRVYETPILLARDPNASPRTRELGEARIEQASVGVWREIQYSHCSSSCKQLREALCYGVRQLYWAITFHQSVRHAQSLCGGSKLTLVASRICRLC